MQEGTAHKEREDLSEICRKQKFSIVIDESTDISVAQILAVMVRFLDETKFKVADALLDTVEVGDETGQGLYTTVKDLLHKRGIPLNNVIGFASDNCATIMGSKCGFQANFKKYIPSVFVLGCVCHSFALCVKYCKSCS